ncbi:MAG: alpha/beta hydrolase [Phocaeicola sp.]
MKKTLVTTLFSICCCLPLLAQGVIGSWSGVLDLNSTKLPILFHIQKKSEGGYTATMDSPSQGAKGIPVTTVTATELEVELSVAAAGIQYRGFYAENKMTGTFKQGNLEIPLTLERLSPEETLASTAGPNRPQEPKTPFPYQIEEVEFTNEQAGITLAGTLTMPQGEGNFPVAVLISGSGPQNRDQEIMSHKPFWVIADHLTRQGIAVLRYDDRGVAKSKGEFTTATSADFATDVASAINYLKQRKEINPKQIGLIGHSEGGLIAPLVAANHSPVAWMVLLAAPGVRGDELLLTQQRLIAKQRGASNEQIVGLLDNNRKLFNKMLETEDTEQLKKQLTEELRAQLPANTPLDESFQKQIDQVANPWMHYFVRYNPTPALEKVTCPVFALNGEKDLQVEAKQNLTAIEKALEKGGNKQLKTAYYPELNHLFQTCTTGDINEYAQIEQTISPQVLSDISNWIKAQIQ